MQKWCWTGPDQKTLSYRRKNKNANSLHTTSAQEKRVQTCVGFSDKCLNRRHTSWFGMTPTPCPTRHLSHHWIMADANKHAERTTNFSREMMNLALLKTCETTSVNIDVTRHPSVKKPLPMRKQVSDENAIHDTHLTNPNVNNLDRTAHESGQKFKTERRHKRRITRRHLMDQQHSIQKQNHYPKPQHNTAAHNMLRNIDCKATSADEKRITWHSRLRAHMTRKLLATMGNQ